MTDPDTQPGSATQAGNGARRWLAVIAAGLLLTAITLVGWAVDSQRSAGAQATARGERAMATLLGLERIFEGVLDAETGQRGFLLTGDDSYLEPYTAARQTLPDHMAEARRLLGAAGDAAQLARLAEVERLMRLKLDELALTVDLAAAGRRAAALRIVQSDEGRDLMRDLRVVVAEMRSVEQADRATFRAASDAAAAALARQIGLAAILLFAMAGVLVWLAFQVARDRTLRASLVQVSAQRDRADALSLELSHRIKNLFAVTASIVTATARETKDDPARLADRIRSRIDALGRSHTLALRGSRDSIEFDAEDTLKEIGLAAVLRQVAGPYLIDRDQLRILGNATVAEDDLTPLGLIVDEMAANAHENGVFSRNDNYVEATISPKGEGGFDLIWIEFAGKPVERIAYGAGFESSVFRIALRQLNATLTAEPTETGLKIRLARP